MTVPVSDRLSQLYVGNGANTRFDFTFRVFQQEDETGIAVRLKGVTEFDTIDPSTYSVSVNQDGMGGFIIFSSAPLAGKYFYIAGLTVLDQLLDITNYDNFYPEAIERALDKLTALLQERSTEIDLEKQARILADIHYDALAMEREADLENRLISYINAMIGITNPAIFDGISDRMIITQDGGTQREFNKSIQFWTGDYVNFKQETYLREEQILAHTNQKVEQVDISLTSKVLSETIRAQDAEQNLQDQVNAVGVGNKAYKTYALMDADKTNIPAKSKVTVTNDATASNNGDWQWDGVVFTKSTYDPLLQAKSYTNGYVLGRELELVHPSSILGATARIGSNTVNLEILGNHVNFTDGFYIGSNGDIVPFASTRISDYIPVEPNDSFFITPSLTYLGAVYDKNLQFLGMLSGSEGGASTVTIIQASAAFVRFNISVPDVTRVYAVVKPTTLPWLYATPSNIADAVNSIANYGNDINLLTGVAFTTGGYIDNNNVINTFEAYKYTNQFVPVEPLSEYVISFAATYVGVFFDASYNFIGAIPGSTGEGTRNYEFITPLNAKYVKINISNNDDAIQSLKLKDYSLSIKPKSAWLNKTIAWYGTSIPAGYPHSSSDAERDVFSHANLAVHDLGGLIINKCVPAGGIGLGVNLSFARTTDAINYQNALLNLIGTENEPDLIVFDYGVNDYDQHPADIDAFDPLDPMDDLNTGTKTKIDNRDANTFIGAHNMIIDAMLTAKSDLKFCFITHFSNDNANPSIAKKQDNWKKLTQCQQALADYWSAPILNLHEKTGYRNRNNFDSITPVMPDHLHPASGDGRSVEQLRNIVRGFLISIA